MSRPTIVDVATQAGVSVATVSRALRGLPNVSEATRSRVHTVAKELRYRIDPTASGLASGRTLTIGLLAPLFSSWYVGQAVAGVEEALSVAGFDLLIHSADKPENRHDALHDGRLARRVDGLLLVDFFVDPARTSDLENLGVPIVTVGEAIDGWSSMTIDNVAGAYMAVQHLLGLGHRNIAFVGGLQEAGYPSPVNALRLDGARAALRDAGLDPDSMIAYDGGYTIEGGRAVWDQLGQHGDRPTAVFCCSDEMAFGVEAAARRQGLDVPRDLSIAGFDGHEMAEVVGLTTVSQQVLATGARAAELLLAHVADPTRSVVHAEAPLELMARSSTAAPSR